MVHAANAARLYKAAQNTGNSKTRSIGLTPPRSDVPMEIPATCSYRFPPAADSKNRLDCLLMKRQLALAAIAFGSLGTARAWAEPAASKLPPAATRKVDFAADIQP